MPRKAMSPNVNRAKAGRRDDPQIGATQPSESVKLTVTLPRSVAAFLRWKAEVEGLSRDELLRRVIVFYAKKLREREMYTPPVTED